MIERPRLLARVAEGLERPLLLLSAPPGFGKTALLTGWRATPAGSAYPMAWVSLDEGDNDPTRFWFYVIAALQTLRPGAGADALAMLQPGAPAPLSDVLMVLINELAEWECDFALVLDDYHVIEATAIHEMVAFLLEHLPPQMHLVLTTRADPPLPLSRFRARGELVEVREKALRFTADEAAAFMTDVQGLTLEAAQLQALADRTEGWAAGLQLAGLTLRESEDAGAFVAAFAGNHRYVVDYLVDEVLRRQPPDLQRFLLETSVLERLSGPLCDAVTGGQESGRVLESLELAGMFLTPLDGERRWYRYHHLFADVLRNQLRYTDPEKVPGLYLRACDWYQGQGLLAEAITCALSAGEAERAAALAEQVVEGLISCGEMTTLGTILGALPEAEVRRRPVLAVARARELLGAGALAQAEEFLRAAEAGGGGDDAAAQAATVRSVAARLQGDFAAAIAQAQTALAAGDRLATPWRVAAEVSLAMALHLTGRTREAAGALGNLYRMAEAAGNAYWSSLMALAQGELEEERGELFRAREWYQTARRHVAAAGGNLPNAGWPLVAEARLLWEWNEPEAALRLLAEGLDLARQRAHGDTLLRGLGMRALLLSEQGDAAGADAALTELDELYQSQPVPQLALLTGATKVQALLLLGRLAEAQWWAERQAESAMDQTALGGLQAFTMARLAAACGDRAGAIRRLEALAAAMAESGREAGVIQCRALMAEWRLANGDRAGALTDLKRAVALGSPAGFVRSLLTAGAGVVSLLGDPSVRAVAPEYVDRLRTAAGESAPAAAATQPLVEPLSEREIEVLHLMAAGLSNQEIADQAYIAVGTVKRHVHNILGKLDAGDRSEAVVRARSLGLL